jgi:hypothetical protein
MLGVEGEKAVEPSALVVGGVNEFAAPRQSSRP